MSKILVIEDEGPVRNNLIELLEAEDFAAVGAENGRVGVQLAGEQLPDLILCDVMMPELDGYGVLAQLRDDPRTATIPLIFLTARAEMSDLRQGMTLGADDYLIKPFTRDDLLHAISVRLSKQATMASYHQQAMDELREKLARSLPHELRTPLVAIIGFAELLEQFGETLSAEEIREMARSIREAGQRLQRLIQNFLLYTELEMAAKDPAIASQLREASDAVATQEIVAAANWTAKQTSRLADLRLECADATLELASSHLNKLVEELLDNAFKFSAAGTPVVVSGQADGETYSLSFTDRGRGMTAAQIADVGAYQQFERKRYEQQGAGLGLIIARRLAELYGGQLKIESRPGERTQVQVALPLARD